MENRKDERGVCSGNDECRSKLDKNLSSAAYKTVYLFCLHFSDKSLTVCCLYL